MSSVHPQAATEAEVGNRYERDRLLLKRFVATRSEEAFAALFRRYHAFVYCTCLRETGDRELAADAAQIVFIALTRKAASIQRGTALTAWLFQAARFAARDLARKERFRMAREQRAVNETMSDLGQRSAGWEEETWRRVDPVLNRALASLSETDRLAILLRYFDEMSFAECGSALGLSGDAARMRIGRALDKLRRHLQRHGVAISAIALAALLARHAQAAAAVPFAVAPAFSGTGLAVHVPGVKGVLFKMNMLFLKPVIVGMVGASAALSVPIIAPIASAPIRSLARAQHPAAHGPGLAADMTQTQGFGDWLIDNPIAIVRPGAVPQSSMLDLAARPEASERQIRADAPGARAIDRAGTTVGATPESFAIRYVLPPDQLPADARALLQQLAAQTVDEDKNARTKQIVTALRGLQKTYTTGSRLDEAVAVRKAVREFKQRMAGVLPDPGNLTGYRGNVGRSYIFSVVGHTNGAVESEDRLVLLDGVAPAAGSLKSSDLGAVLLLRGQEAGNPTKLENLGGEVSTAEGALAGTMLDYSTNSNLQSDRAAAADTLTILDNTVRLMRGPGLTSGPVWGTDIYTDDSSLAAVAVHAGILREGEQGLVKVTIFAGRDEYEGTAKHGVTSSSYGAWDGSYMVEKAPPLEPVTPAKLPTEASAIIARLGPPEAAPEEAFNETLRGLRSLKASMERAAKLDEALLLRDAIASTVAGRLGALPDPATLTVYRGQNGRRMFFQVTGRTNGSIWGSDPYTDDTDIGTAAVHAGLLKPGQTGVLQVTPLPGLASYSASRRNGIAASAYAAWTGSYRLELVTAY